LFFVCHYNSNLKILNYKNDISLTVWAEHLSVVSVQLSENETKMIKKGLFVHLSKAEIKIK